MCSKRGPDPERARVEVEISRWPAHERAEKRKSRLQALLDEPPLDDGSGTVAALSRRIVVVINELATLLSADDGELASDVRELDALRGQLIDTEMELALADTRVESAPVHERSTELAQRAGFERRARLLRDRQDAVQRRVIGVVDARRDDPGAAALFCELDQVTASLIALRRP